MSFGFYPYSGNPYQNNPYQQQLAQMQQAQMQSQQNNLFIHVPSEEAARSYSVAPGSSVTFINDYEPYCYTKSCGSTQFDKPVFKKFRLVEESTASEQQKPQQSQVSSITVDSLSDEIKSLKSRIEALENRPNEPIMNPQNERRAKNEPFNKQQRQSQSNTGSDQ